MAFRLFERITMMAKADAHGIVESLEDRTLLLKQYLREAELELDRKRARLEALHDEAKRSRDLLASRESEVRALDEDIALALQGGKDDLARFAIRRLLPKRAEIEAFRAQVEGRAADAATLTERLREQELKLEALRTRVRSEVAAAPDPGDPPSWIVEPVVANEEIEIELLRRKGAQGGTR